MFLSPSQGPAFLSLELPLDPIHCLVADFSGHQGAVCGHDASKRMWDEGQEPGGGGLTEETPTALGLSPEVLKDKFLLVIIFLLLSVSGVNRGTKKGQSWVSG